MAARETSYGVDARSFKCGDELSRVEAGANVFNLFAGVKVQMDLAKAKIKFAALWGVCCAPNDG
ncbi:MAG: hypothetical protein WKF84_13890 [Pyrinomonadaceae bacterium]